VPNLTVSGREPLPELPDWRADHRPLANEQRAQIATYIRAIVARDSLAASPEAGHALAQALWVSFRETYDGLRGTYGRSDAEDFWRAMRRL
jgi:hypothetical protein